MKCAAGCITLPIWKFRGKCLKNAVIKVGILITNKLEHIGATIYITLGSSQTELDIAKVKR